MRTNIATTGAFDPSAVRGVALTVLGIIAIAFPVAASVTTTYIVAWVLIVAGFTHLLFGSRGGSMVWAWFVGLAYVLAGIAILANPLWGLATIALVLGVALLFEGALSVIAYFAMDNVSKWVLVSGCLTIVLALFIAGTWTAQSLWMIGALVGVNLVVRGATSIAAWLGEERQSGLPTA